MSRRAIVLSALVALLLAISVLAQVRTVTRVGIVARPRVYNGPCPANVEFTATVFVSRHPVWVEYVWERSDGARSPRKRMLIRAAGEGVSTTWALGRYRDHVDVWERLHVLAPTGISSPMARVRVNCR